MTAVSPTTTTTIDPRTCPAWCTIKNEEHDWYDSGDAEPVRNHEGPMFGPVRTVGQQQFDGSFAFDMALGMTEDVLLTAREARNVASSLQQAAEWIEAHEQAETGQ